MARHVAKDKNLHRFASTQKDHILSQKMNYNRNMDSTIAGSVNVCG